MVSKIKQREIHFVKLTFLVFFRFKSLSRICQINQMLRLSVVSKEASSSLLP